MIQNALSNYPLINLNLIALGIFLTVFFGMLIWIFRKDSNSYYEKASNLPLEGQNGRR